jgi:hypothetical protein
MTVASTTSRARFTGNGVTTAFPLPFRVLDAADVQVSRVVGGTATALTLGPDFTVSGVGSVGNATVTLTTALPTGSDLLVVRFVPVLQPTDIRNQGAFLPSIHEDVFDRLTMIDQQQDTDIARSLQLGPIDVDGTGSYDAGGNRIRNVGAPLVGSDVVTLATLGSALAPVATQSQAAGAPVLVPGSTVPRTLGARFGEVFHVEDFGAIGDGVTNDRVAINLAMQAATAAGGGVVRFGAGKSYFVGTLNGTPLFVLDSPQRLVIDGQHAEIVGQTVATSITNVLELRNPERVTIVDLSARDLDYRDGVDWWGLCFMSLLSAGTGGTVGRVLISNCHATDAVTFLRTGGTVARRVRDITLLNCSCEHLYYGINAQENGDGLRAVNFRFINGRRAYFPYGVRDHVVDLTVAHDGVTPGAAACVLIKRIARDTRNLQVRLTMEGTGLAYGTAVKIETQTDDANAVLDQIDVTLALRGLASPTSMVPVTIVATDAAGVYLPTTTHIITEISIRGDLGGYQASLVPPVLVDSVPATEGRIVLDGLRGALTAVARPLDYPGFRVQMDGTEIRTKRGNLTTAPFVIPLTTLDAQSIPMRVVLHVHSDVTALTSQNSVVREDVLLVINAGGGPVSVLATQGAFTALVQGNAPTVTYGASGETLTVAIAGSDYTGANAYARCSIEYLVRAAA